MKAYILGAGPAGMVAAHALAMKGYEIEIGTDRMSPSVISGAQYLDLAIPGITELNPDGYVTFLKHGQAEGYAQKIYGDPKAPTSWDKYINGNAYPLWYLRDTYSLLWERYKEHLFNIKVDANVLAAFVDTDADLIVVALPLVSLCINPEHVFHSQEVTIYPGLPTDMPKKFEHLMKKEPDFNWILYNGKKKYPWYRCSAINQGASVEVPGHFEDGHRISKPLSTDCDCWSNIPRIVRVGRYGTWEKNELVSGAWNKVLEAHLVVQ